MSDDKQKEIANEYCAQIDTYLTKLESSSSKRQTIIIDVNRLTIASAVLPVILTFVSAYAYILTQQVVTLFANLGNVIPPILINMNKSKMQDFNDCSDLQLKLISLKGYINRLATLNQLNDEKIKEIDSTLKNLDSSMEKFFKIHSL